MRLYNALTNTKMEALPTEQRPVRLYACGPTVYNYIHIGNARPIVTVDLMVRALRMQGVKVDYLQNYTDVDDKIIKKAIEEHSDERTVSERYIAAFVEDVTRLNAILPNHLERISNYMSEQIDFISKLVANDDAYLIDGDVYFRVNKYNRKNKLWYGQLSNKNIDELIAGERVEISEKKENPLDFTLWKKTKEGVTWTSKFGAGRPGWHTECAVLNDLFFNHQTIDIHAGGIDLKFPHHENERIQFIALNNRDLANVWIYNGHITMDDEKMSKSLGNIILLRDFLNDYGANVLRYLFYGANYRQPLNISDGIIAQAQTETNKLLVVFKQVNIYQATEKMNDEPASEDFVKKALAFVNDDLNSANALTTLSDLVKTINAQIRAKTLSRAMIKQLTELSCSLFGFKFDVPVIDKKIKALLVEWDELKHEKRFAEADCIRQRLIEMNVL